MLLIGRPALESFARRHPDAEGPLSAWAKIVVSRDFRHFVDLRGTLGSADYVKPFVVFDIAGNKYRLIALVDYASQIVAVKYVLTHAEYDSGAWRR